MSSWATIPEPYVFGVLAGLPSQSVRRGTLNSKGERDTLETGGRCQLTEDTDKLNDVSQSQRIESHQNLFSISAKY